MKSKFFSIEYTSERNGEIADIITSNQITAQTFSSV